MKSVLIVGHGLAGAILAQTFHSRGIFAACFEGEIIHSASRVAAGLINPYIGPKLNIPKDFTKCIKSNRSFFTDFEKKHSCNLYSQDSLIRIFKSTSQRKLWDSLSTHNRQNKFTERFISPETLKKLNIEGRHGAGLTKIFRLEVNKFLKISKDLLIRKNLWQNKSFHESDITNFDLIIFAEGFNVDANNFFNWLPFSHAKGEIIKLRGPNVKNCSNGTWLLSDSNNHCMAGSTWEHENLKSGPTSHGKLEIIKNINYIDLQNHKVINHVSGIRSCTLDRYPIIGRHFEFSKLAIFNGFGSRGATMVSYYANILVDHLFNGSDIPPYVSIERFKRYFTE